MNHEILKKGKSVGKIRSDQLTDEIILDFMVLGYKLRKIMGVNVLPNTPRSGILGRFINTRA